MTRATDKVLADLERQCGVAAPDAASRLAAVAAAVAERRARQPMLACSGCPMADDGHPVWQVFHPAGAEGWRRTMAPKCGAAKAAGAPSADCHAVRDLADRIVKAATEADALLAEHKAGGDGDGPC